MTRAVPQVDATIDFRMMRRAYLERVWAGEVSQREACDAHRDLVSAAQRYGKSRRTPCPLCAGDQLRSLTYLFGPRLPRSGRCVTTSRDLDQHSRASGTYTAYVVEVCLACHWHHLLTARPLGERGTRTRQRKHTATRRRRTQSA